MSPLTPAGDTAAETRDGRPAQAEADELIKPNDRLNSLERLEIYNRQYWYRILDALYDDFPGLRAAIGARAFDKLSQAYLTDCPSESFTMRNLGARLESWLRAHPEFAGKNFDLARDMIRLEWAHIEAFDNAERKPIGPEDLLELLPALGLSLQPNMSLLELRYPVDDLRIEANRLEEVHDSASNAMPERKPRHPAHRYRRLKPKQIYLAVYRHDDAVWYRRLDAEEYRLLGAFAAGKSIEDAVNTAIEGSSLPEAALSKAIEEYFATWSQLGCLCAAPEGL